jgi:hypothetical protein
MKSICAVVNASINRTICNRPTLTVSSGGHKHANDSFSTITNPPSSISCYDPALLTVSCSYAIVVH